MTDSIPRAILEAKRAELVRQRARMAADLDATSGAIQVLDQLLAAVVVPPTPRATSPATVLECSAPTVAGSPANTPP